MSRGKGFEHPINIKSTGMIDILFKREISERKFLLLAVAFALIVNANISKNSNNLGTYGSMAGAKQVCQSWKNKRIRD